MAYLQGHASIACSTPTTLDEIENFCVEVRGGYLALASSNQIKQASHMMDFTSLLFGD